MKLFLVASIYFACLFAGFFAYAQGHVNLDRSQVPYGGDVYIFCENGYPSHNWAPLIPSMGRWIVIVPNKPVNYQYIASYELRCRSGGMVK